MRQKAPKKALSFCISGKPIAKQRPRLSRFGKAYDLQGAEKKKARLIISEQIAEFNVLRPIGDAIAVKVTFYTSIPQSWSRKRQNANLHMPDTRRPDIDNYIKFYFDIMNGIVYEDDSQITHLTSKKIYSDEPRVEICIKEINDDL